MQFIIAALLRTHFLIPSKWNFSFLIFCVHCLKLKFCFRLQKYLKREDKKKKRTQKKLYLTEGITSISYFSIHIYTIIIISLLPASSTKNWINIRMKRRKTSRQAAVVVDCKDIMWRYEKVIFLAIERNVIIP